MILLVQVNIRLDRMQLLVNSDLNHLHVHFGKINLSAWRAILTASVAILATHQGIGAFRWFGVRIDRSSSHEQPCSGSAYETK